MDCLELTYNELCREDNEKLAVTHVLDCQMLREGSEVKRRETVDVRHKKNDQNYL